MLEKYLQDIGLNDKEAAIYLALLSYEDASVLELAEKTKIKRPTVYVILESLAKKGLVSETTVGKKTHYYAEPPERLETFLERKIINLEESKRVLKDIVPQLKSVSREHGEKPIVKYFEGKEGIFSAHQEFLSSINDNNEPMYTIYSNDLVEEVFSEADLGKFRQARAGKKLHIKSMYTSSKGERETDSTADRLRIDETKYPISCDITTYKDTVLVTVLGKRISAVMMKNKDIATTMKSLFSIVFDNKKS
jgi:sugar-specific transcriptional regulator TrmB